MAARGVQSPAAGRSSGVSVCPWKPACPSCTNRTSHLCRGEQHGGPHKCMPPLSPEWIASHPTRHLGPARTPEHTWAHLGVCGQAQQPGILALTGVAHGHPGLHLPSCRTQGCKGQPGGSQRVCILLDPHRSPPRRPQQSAARSLRSAPWCWAAVPSAGRINGVTSEVGVRVLPAVNECGVLGPSSRGEVLETPILHLSGVGGLRQCECVRGACLQGSGC